MADFCTKCTHEMNGEETTPDIDVQKEFESLEEGMCSSGWLCEGCGLSVIGKIDGELKVIRIPLDDDEELSDWENY
jgi:hypothetical protein